MTAYPLYLGTCDVCAGEIYQLEADGPIVGHDGTCPRWGGEP